MSHEYFGPIGQPDIMDSAMSAVADVACSVLVDTVTLSVMDGQRRIVGLLDLPGGGAELSGWLEADVPNDAWRGWLVTGDGEVVWLQGAAVH